MKVGAIIVAAGNSSRMGQNKLFIKIGGKEVLLRTLIAFNDSRKVDYIVIVSKIEMFETINEFKDKYNLNKVIAVMEGGESRQESVKKGILKCDNDTDIILIHDGARPFVSDEIINNGIYECEKYGTAIPVVPVKDTIKEVNNFEVINTPKRETLYLVQTPQIFAYNKYCEYISNVKIEFTDDSGMFEYMGEKIHTFRGDYKNIKITTTEDLLVAESFLEKEVKSLQRIGNGYDVHRLDFGRNLILGGVKIDYEKGLIGHSDADVLTHAIIDSILGAIGERDIGYLFPDSDDNFKDINSLNLLKRVKEIVYERGYKIINIDSIIIAEKPKLSGIIQKMRENISSVLDMDVTSVNVKATTEEGLGFIGRGEGIAAQAVCLVEKE